jgi:DNA-binding NtrC family response regulator
MQTLIPHQRRRCLLVSKDPGVLRVVTQALSECGTDTTICNDIRGLQRRLSHRDYQLVFVDANPTIATDALHSIKSRSGDIPIVIVRERGKDGAPPVLLNRAGVVIKPLKLANTRKVIAQLFSNDIRENHGQQRVYKESQANC